MADNNLVFPCLMKTHRGFSLYLTSDSFLVCIVERELILLLSTEMEQWGSSKRSAVGQQVHHEPQPRILQKDQQ